MEKEIEVLTARIERLENVALLSAKALKEMEQVLESIVKHVDALNNRPYYGGADD